MRDSVSGADRLPGKRRESHALLLQSVSSQPLLLRSLQSEDVETTGSVLARATLMSMGPFG
jgi:hypothetical protein